MTTSTSPTGCLSQPAAERFVWHPYTQMLTAAPPIDVVRGEGEFLYAADGTRYIDAISSWWVTLHGHAHPKIAEAVARQARQLEQVMFTSFTHPPARQLAERLATILPAGLSRVFYSDDGSTAIEVALKMALQFWSNRGCPERQRIIALEHAYHGDTAGAMSVSARSCFTQPFERVLFPVERVASAYCYRCPVGLTRERCDIECTQQLADVLHAHGVETAAMIVEPLLQGAGGMIVHPLEFLRRVRRLCDESGVLLIVDEVLTGFGRTGTMFACEQAGIVPDIVCLSKGLTGGFLPLGATVCREPVYEAFLSEDRRRTFFHGHSFTANPIACAAALASLDIFDSEPVFERIAAIAQYHAQRLASFQGHPRVGDVRQIGTVAALELRDADGSYLSEVGPRLQRFYLDAGVVLRPLGPVVYVLPPYCISSESLERVWDAVDASLAQ